MKRFNRILILIAFIFSLFLFGCTPTIDVYAQLQTALDSTINEIKENYDLENITEDIDFIYEDEYGFSYLWDSSNPDVISDNGFVTRKLNDVEVTITVRVYSDDVYCQGSFTCIVVKLKSDGYTYDIEGTKSLLTIYELNEVEEDEEYNNYLDVVAYIYYFHKLPSNYLTKSQAKSLGWRGSGNVWVNDQLQGKNIGGDTFNNREGRLPATASNTYVEVDVNNNGGSRGMYRIVYNRYTFDIYYTADHYGTFTFMIGVLNDSNS